MQGTGSDRRILAFTNSEEHCGKSLPSSLPTPKLMQRAARVAISCRIQESASKLTASSLLPLLYVSASPDSAQAATILLPPTLLRFGGQE